MRGSQEKSSAILLLFSALMQLFDWTRFNGFISPPAFTITGYSELKKSHKGLAR